MVAERIEGDSLTLRRATAADHDRILRVLQDSAVEQWWGHYDADRVAAEYSNEDTVVYFIDIAGQVAGIIQYSEETDPQYRHAGIDIALVEASRRQGIGPRAIQALARYLFDKRGHHRLTIDPAAANRNAIRAYEKVGFQRVGIMRQYERGSDGTWRDGLLMDLLAEELPR